MNGTKCHFNFLRALASTVQQRAITRTYSTVLTSKEEICAKCANFAPKCANFAQQQVTPHRSIGSFKRRSCNGNDSSLPFRSPSHPERNNGGSIISVGTSELREAAAVTTAIQYFSNHPSTLQQHEQRCSRAASTLHGASTRGTSSTGKRSSPAVVRRRRRRLRLPIIIVLRRQKVAVGSSKQRIILEVPPFCRIPSTEQTILHYFVAILPAEATTNVVNVCSMPPQHGSSIRMAGGTAWSARGSLFVDYRRRASSYWIKQQRRGVRGGVPGASAKDHALTFREEQ